MSRARIYKTVMACGLVLLGLQAAYAANNLETIGVSRVGDSVAVRISTSAGCEFNAFLTEAKPERIVIDLTGVTNDLPRQQFMDLPTKTVRSIRTSQFKTAPELQARVVLDIGRPVDFRYYRDGGDIVVTMPAIPDEIQFSAWQSSGDAKEADVVETRVVETPVVEAPVVPAPVVETPVVETKTAVAGAVETEVVETKAVETTEADAEVAEAEPAVEEPGDDPVYQPAEDNPAANSSAPVQTSTQVALDDPSLTQGIQVETAPKRKTVEYTENSLRDPFAPLVGVRSGKVTEGLPSLENLKLVGILEDSKIHRALLEDAEGNGYMLKPNDRVQSGYLVAVTNSKAIFQVTEYGWTRTVALELEIPDIR